MMNNEIVKLLNGLDGYMGKMGQPQMSASRVAKEKTDEKSAEGGRDHPKGEHWFAFVRLRSPLLAFFWGGGGPKCGMWGADRGIGSQSVALCREMSPCVALCRFAPRKFFPDGMGYVENS
jgi:hypothetical protein